MKQDFTKEHGLREACAQAVRRASLTDGKNIGPREIPFGLIRGLEIDPPALNQVFDSGTFLSCLPETRPGARAKQIQSMPIFVKEGRELLIGTQSLPNFRTELRKFRNLKAGQILQ